MKKLIICCILLIGAVLATAQTYSAGDMDTPQKPVSPKGCPATNFVDNSKCMTCHKMIVENGQPKFGLKEVDPGAKYDPPYKTKLVWDGTEQKFTPYFLLGRVDSNDVENFLEYVSKHPELGKKVIVEIFSPGGSLMQAWRIISIFSIYEAKGFIIETRCNGFAASAGFLIMVGGTKGHRKVSPVAEFMWHEIWSIEFLKLETPSQKEQEAKVYRHLMNTIHNWLASRSGITKTELDEIVKFKEYWLNGVEMVQKGFADSFVNE